MYFIAEANDRTQEVGLRGFARIRDTSDRQRSLDAILRALQLNRVGGYVKGSSARRQLEEAFESVPRTSALELFNQLGRGEGPLGRLFQYRLHDVTKVAMRNILWRKHLEQQQQLQEAQQRLKQVCEEEKKKIEELRAALKKFESSGERLCKLYGEDSDQCQKFRFALLEDKMKLDERIRRSGLLCP
jgi:hypothetical protein